MLVHVTIVCHRSHTCFVCLEHFHRTRFRGSTRSQTVESVFASIIVLRIRKCKRRKQSLRARLCGNVPIAYFIISYIIFYFKQTFLANSRQSISRDNLQILIFDFYNKITIKKKIKTDNKIK